MLPRTADHGRARPGRPRRRPCVTSTVAALLGILLLLPGPVSAAAPTGFTETLVAGGLSSPTAMTIAPDGRLFVAEQGGQLRVVKNGVLLAQPFLTVVVNSSGERGLLGIAFDPAFASNNFVYVYYTATSPAIHNRLSRFTAAGDVAVAGSEVVILELDNLSGATNHNGGAIHFGPDGKLYVAVGENANGANAQSFNNLLGKVLRINADGSVPTDNPFYASTSGRNRAIWAIGLRNPFTFSFQRGTSRMFINDVGQSTWEEINQGVAGANYGWPETEGPTSDSRFRGPVSYYGHTSGECAITGGAFYNPPTMQFPADYAGDYFFADFCGGWIRRLDLASGSVSNFASGIASPVDLQVANDGSLYYLARGNGSVYRVAYTGSLAPTIGTHPANRTVSVGQSATFTVVANGTPPLSYQWLRNGATISGATSSSYTVSSAQLSDSGARFRVRVTNTAGNVLSNEATLTVTSNQAPTATITQPVAGTLYVGGQTITYAGTGMDPEEGTLAASRFTWRVDFHHDRHVHPFIADTIGSSSGSFVIPATGHTESNVWYRIHLTVRDSAGLTSSVYRDVTPRTVNVTLATNPAGLQVRLDGQPQASPLTFTGVVGIQRTIEAAAQQVMNGTTWEFVSWSDGGAGSHVITTPGSNTTITATYRAVASKFQNPSFEATGTAWFSPWLFTVRSPAAAAIAQDATTAAEGSRSLRVTISQASTDWYVQLLQGGLRLEAGVPYTFSFWAKASSNRTIRVAFQRSASPYTLYFQRTESVGTTWVRHEITFTPSMTDANALFSLNVGTSVGQIWFDGVT